MFGCPGRNGKLKSATAAMCVVSTSSTGMDIRNNIFANNIPSGTTSIANVAMYLPSGGTSAMNLTNNKNSYYFGTDVARQGAGQAGTTAERISIQLCPRLLHTRARCTRRLPMDNASIASTGAVPFATATDLHITSAAPEYETGCNDWERY
jgi:hypothetical protein